MIQIIQMSMTLDTENIYFQLILMNSGKLRKQAEMHMKYVFLNKEMHIMK